MKVLDINGLGQYDQIIKNTYATKTYVDTQDALKAPLASPAFTGNPTAKTQTKADNSTKIATTKFVKDNLSDYVTATSLNTTLGDYVTTTALNTALENFNPEIDPSDIDLSGYLKLTGGTLTGTVNGVTPTKSDNSTKLATTAFVKTNLGDYVSTTSLNTTLQDYVTGSSLNTTLGNYVTSSGLSTTLGSYVTSSSLNTTLGNYVTSSGLTTTLSDYVTDSDLTTTLGDYVTSTDLEDALDDFTPSGSGSSSFSSNYIRFDNGVQICWGGTSFSNGILVQTSFPVPFYSNPSIAVSDGNFRVVWGTNQSTTGFVDRRQGFTFQKMDNSASDYAEWIAIGIWKAVSGT